MFGATLRCPTCNKYTPDRCTCPKVDVSIPVGYAICPCCKGNGRRTVPENSRQYAGILAGYDKSSDTLACENCGGQTMSGRALGYTKLDEATREGCQHEYVGRNAGRCYTIYTCKKCRSSYDIDSSD